MFNKFITSIEPFALTLIVLAGMSLAGWLQFTNHAIVGVATVFVGVLLVIRHITLQMSSNKEIEK